MEPITYSRLIVQALTFFVAIFATVWAVELHNLLKTGEVGKTWRVVTIATILFAVIEVIKFAELFQYFPVLHIHEYLELPFIFLLAIACYMQRKAFYMPQHFRKFLISRRNGSSHSPGTDDGLDFSDDDFELEELEMLEPIDER